MRRDLASAGPLVRELSMDEIEHVSGGADGIRLLVQISNIKAGSADKGPVSTEHELVAVTPRLGFAGVFARGSF